MKISHQKLIALVFAMLPLWSHGGESTPASAGQQAVFIESVQCVGNERVPCDYIRRKLHLRGDSSIDDRDLGEAILRLSSLPDFESVNVRLEKGSARGRAVLLVEVVETDAIAVELVGRAWHQNVERFMETEKYYGAEVGAKIGHQDLFGQRKIIELGLWGVRQSGDFIDGTRLSGSLIYIDPQLFGHDRWFGSARVTLRQSEIRDSVPSWQSNQLTPRVDIHSESRETAVEVSVGRRLWDYSYLFFSHSQTESRDESDWIGATTLDLKINQSMLVYGWDSEDDVYFPTRGSSLSFAASYHQPNCPSTWVCESETDFLAAYKHTWGLGDRSFLTLNLGGEPLVSTDRLRPTTSPAVEDLQLTYSRELDRGSWDNIRRARWYVGMGYSPIQIRTEGRIGGEPDNLGLTIGLRLDTRNFGIIDLSIGAQDVSL